jgi:glutamate formiminotransferase / formiminotetrahydrofolate cyclodeaminase
MNKIVECVPNFSEGRDRSVIDAIAGSISSVEGITLLNVDPGASTNRTVVTFVGPPDAVVEAAFQGAKTAYERIDMRKHSGAHPRLGAVDVVPFVPVAGVSMEECVALSKEFGRRVGEELGVPVYLYEEASANPERKALRQIRSGEYEGLKSKISEATWKPDFGPKKFLPESGATVTGARFFLIAYNVNILGTRNQAHRIALNIREQGRTVTRPDGTKKTEPGRLKAVKGIGWYLDEFNLAQVSMNLDNYRVTPLHTVFEEIKKDAAALNVGVAGSEVVGLVPLDAVLMAAEYYIQKENLFILDEAAKVRLAIDRLGLSSLHPFNPEEKIIEYMIDRDTDGPLIKKTVRGFVAATGARTSTPGGGSVAALMGSLGAALGAMVGWLTYGRRKYEHLDGKMRAVIPPLIEIQEALLASVDRDTDAFNDYMDAIGMPAASPVERERREQAMMEGLKKATLVPLETMQLADRAWEPIIVIATWGQFSSRSDVLVGAKALEAAVYGAHKNVLINLADIADEEFNRDIKNQADALLSRAGEKLKEVSDIIERRTGDVSAES